MSISNLLADGNAAQLDLKVNSIDCEGVLGATDITCASLDAADEITATNRVFAPRIEASIKLWSERATTINRVYAGATLTSAVSQVAGHISVAFSTVPLVNTATMTYTLTNVNFEANAPTFVNKSRWVGVGEGAGARGIEVYCSFAAAGSINVIIANSSGASYAGNVDFDFIQF